MTPDMEMMNLQTLQMYGGTRDGITMQPPDKDGNFSFLVFPKETYAGFVDGIQNDNFMNFSIVQGVSEKWVYHNLDNQDSHPLHFHLTSAYMNPEEEENQWTLQYPYQPYGYSLDSYGVPPQQTLSFYLAFLKHNSFEGQISYLGYMYHCHFMTHHDMMMMGQYFVYPLTPKSKW
jgi:FtsP/CotA-like multicopper oxidase with cupredoxin domain